MRIVLVSKSDIIGGAAIAANRLFQALRKADPETILLVQEKRTFDNQIIGTTKTAYKKFLNFYHFIWERLLFFPQERSKELRFAFSIANTGEDISKIGCIRSADIINLHWINQGFLSLRSIQNLTELNKPIVWTLHDMWPFTGGCHYAEDCTRYLSFCRNCPFLKRPHSEDLSYKIFKKKQSILRGARLTIVTNSRWLKQVAERSTLLKAFRIEHIPTPIDFSTFALKDRRSARAQLGLDEDKQLILFGAMNPAERRKGLKYLCQALGFLVKNRPQLKKHLEVVIFGKSRQDISELVPVKTTYLGFLSSSEKLSQAYNACDLFVIPSLEDNLPNTVIEAHSCGLPVVGFKTGGIAEMVDHKKDGYLANCKSTEGLAAGIYWALFYSNKEHLSVHARHKSLVRYSQKRVALQYLKLFDEIRIDH